jgi:hypothetical protein
MTRFLDRVRVYSTTTGTGAVGLGAALRGFQDMAGAGALDGDELRYLIEHTGATWEIGRGVWSAATGKLTRNVVASSSGGAPLNLATTATVSVIVDAATLDALAHPFIPPPPELVFEQAIPAAQWVIVHGLGKPPMLIVLDSTGRTVEGDIRYDGTTSVTISFGAAFAGTAYCY